MVEVAGIVEILKLANDSVQGFILQRDASSHVAWEEVTLALDKLSELTTLHIRAVSEVTSPILTAGDIAETSRRYDLLVNNPDFPQGYGRARGIIEATLNIRTFNHPPIREKTVAVLNSLYNFQYGVFTKPYDSYRVTDAIAECARVAGNQITDAAQIAEAGKPLVKAFKSVFEEEALGLPEHVAQVADLIQLVQVWCKTWQRYAARKLYDGRGLNYHIGQLRMEQYR